MTMETQTDWQIGKSLLDRMKYMLDNQLMCDVTFHVGSDRSPIKAHKYMLASASPVFYSMFEGPLSEKGDVDIADIIPEYFSMMLQYIYTEKIVIDAKNITGLLYGSEKYMLQTLKDKCNEFLTSSVDEEHACVVFQTAHDFHIKDLETNALNFIFKNGRACFESDDFLHLSSDCLKLIVESDKLYCDETTIYQRMVQWSKLRCEEQSMSMTDENVRKSLGDLIYLIRFPLMTPKYFTNEVSSQKILTYQEKVGVYEHFNDKQTDIFNSTHRTSPFRSVAPISRKSRKRSYDHLNDMMRLLPSFE
ncbi:BTB/POZ domain-containing protein 6-like [Mytilus edulis]|uniref:BTB/POZ domain-containing protein 6-like n=1 Tax=Mytilus edulis TaxID=6550 RepID=UPI0039F024E8